VQVISRPGCHLCEEALAVVAQVCDRAGMPFEVTSVVGDPALEAQFGDLVPVVLVDGREVARYRITAAELRSALNF
jgi:hypothetical protein